MSGARSILVSLVVAPAVAVALWWFGVLASGYYGRWLIVLALAPLAGWLGWNVHRGWTLQKAGAMAFAMLVATFCLWFSSILLLLVVVSLGCQPEDYECPI
jgi:hypothetical protein